jgi:hypothetical protein
MPFQHRGKLLFRIGRTATFAFIHHPEFTAGQGLHAVKPTQRAIAFRQRIAFRDRVSKHHYDAWFGGVGWASRDDRQPDKEEQVEERETAERDRVHGAKRAQAGASVERALVESLLRDEEAK